jgi:hypothetical protein
MYLEVGETNEALFWINVGVEALFQHRFRQISQTINDPELFDELSSPKAYWHEAEEVVREQFPELADRISWPGTTKHVSVYQKLKYLYRRVSMKTSVNEMISNYSKVSKNRNALFHGATEKRLPVNAVEKAISSFDWIVENFTLTEDDQT